jgi:hypothetical protein
MQAFLVERNGKARNGYYYTDEGLDIAGVGNLMSSKYVKFRIIGMVWKDCGWYLCEVERYGRKHYLALTNGTGVGL